MTEACAVSPSALSASASRTGSPRENPRWYVVQSKPREDTRALANLERQGFTCYCPMRSVEKLQQGRRTKIEGPLFPGYLFIRLKEVGQGWAPIRSTRGVLQLVRFNDYPLPVPDDVVERIRSRLMQVQYSVPYLQPGERVRITHGPFAHLEAIFLAGDGSERVLLLMKILQREQRLSFPVGSVRKARAIA